MAHRPVVKQNFYINKTTILFLVSIIVFSTSYCFANIYLNYFIFAVYFGIGYWLYRRSYMFLVFIGWIFYQHFLQFISNVYIEHGNYIPEQFRAGYFNGASHALLIYFLITCLLLFLFFSNVKIRVRSYNHIYNRLHFNNPHLWVLITVIVIFLVYGLTASKGFVLLKEPGLHPGARHTQDWLLLKIRHLLPYISLILGVLAVDKRFLKAERIWVLFLFGILLLYYILMGHKASYLLVNCYFFFLPVLAISYIEERKKFSHYIGSITVVFFLIIGLTMSYYASTAGSFTGAEELFQRRLLSLQGHVWFGVHDQASMGTKALAQTLEGPSRSELSWRGHWGQPSLMFAVSDDKFVAEKLEKGGVFTGGYPAIAIHRFGYIGALGAFFLLCAVYGTFARIMCEFVVARDFFHAFIAMNVFQKLTIGVMSMGNLHLVCNYEVLLITLYLMMKLIFEKNRNLQALSTARHFQPSCKKGYLFENTHSRPSPF